MTPDEWNQRVGLRIRGRREALRLSATAAAKAAGFSEAQWRQMESGRRTVATNHVVTVNPRPDTRAKACRVLRWTDDSIDLLEAGEEPIELDDTLPDDARSLIAEHTALIEELQRSVAAIRRDHEELVAEVRGRAHTPEAPGRERAREVVLATAAEGADGAPPRRIGRTTSGPTARPEDGDHLTD